MTSSDIQDLGSLLETARKFRERGHFKAVIDLVQTLIDTEDVSWEFYWELALAAKELGLVDVVDQATAEVMLKNSEFWFARELPKHARGYYSQLGQDEIVEQFFAVHSPKSRVFVEVGAFDGVHYSNVRRLQETYGWSGVSIEPVGQNFEKLSKSYTGRPVVCVRCAVGDKEGVAELNVSTYPHLPDWGSDVATFSESETQRWQQTYGAVWHKEHVPVKTLTSVLQENNIGVIDFLSVDAEGHDLDVLKGLDLSIYRPKLIVVEYNRNRQEIFDFLADNGYRLFKDNGQDLFMELAVESNFSGIDTIPLSASDDDISQSLEYRDRVLKTLSCHEADGLIVAASPNVPRIPPVAISGFGRQPAAGSGRSTMNADVRDKLNPHLLALGTLPLDKPIRRLSTTPLNLLTSSRFDIIPKFVYAGFREFGIDSSWGKELYEAHLCAFNDCDEGDGSGKVGFESFKDAFDSLLDSVKAGGFDPRISLVPTGRNGVIIDGAHRVAACMLYCQPVEILEFHLMANCYNYEYFLGKGLNSDFCDAIALAFCQLKSQAYIVSVFPSAVGRELEIREILERNGEIFYARQVQLSRLGSVNLVRQMYDGEHWVGNFANRFEGAQNKAAECFRIDGPVRVYVFTSDDFEKVKAAKQQIRDLFGIGNHSVHINDTHEETVRLGRLLLNANSVHFLNNAQLTSFPRFQTHLENYKKVLREKGVTGEYLCIDGSAVMAAYGIREARDLDYLHFGYNDLTFDYPPELIGSHNSEIAHHVTTRDDIIFNPRNHFYYDGVKFASLGIIRAMKEKRGEPKDYEDVALIDRFVIIPPSPPHVNIPAAPAAGVVRQPKIVGLVPARNEKHAIAQCLRALSLFTDAIVYLDDASTDETPDIVASLAIQCRIERIICKKEWHRDEPGDRNAMLRAGREIGGTHFIVIDADEMLTSNLLGSPGLRGAILKLQPGDRLALNWIQLWRSIDQYRFDQSVWTWNYKEIIFCDDGRCSYSSEFIHTPRAPGDLSGNRYTIQGYEAGLLHFQFVNWRNLLVKQAWYRCLEHIREPAKPATEINVRYAPSKDESGLGLAPSPAVWFSGYPFFDRTVYDRPDEWREEQIAGWFRQYGRKHFAELDIWDVTWREDVLPAQGNWLAADLKVKSASNNMIEVNGVLGYLNEGDMDFLRQSVARVKHGATIVGIGSFLGLSALTIARELHQRGDTLTKLYCVDSWQKASTSYQHAEKGGFRKDFFRTFSDNVQASGLSPYIVPINDASIAAASRFADQSIDLLFVDGDHSYAGCYGDLTAWFHKVKPGGILIGHDCTPTSGVRQAVVKFCSERGINYVIHEPPICHYMYEFNMLAFPNPINGNRGTTRVTGEAPTQSLVFPESRLAHQLLDGLKGLEIGASAHNPFGLNTRNVGLCIDGYIQEQLGFCGRAVTIDIEAPAHAIPVPDESEDFIVSSHVVEHCPDLIRSFLEWFRIVRPGGYLFMIVPHRNASSADVGRPLTDWAHVCEDFRNDVSATTEADPKVYANQHCHVFEPETLKGFIAATFGNRLELVAEQQIDDKVGNGFTLAYRKARPLAAAYPWSVQAADGGSLEMPHLASPGMNSYRVTAVVSTYRSEAFMRGCLEDLVNQTLHRRAELEIIVIDSASPENEGAIVKEFQQHSPHIRYIRSPERESIYKAWNRGIKAAQGKYITNANTDDRHREDALEVMARELDTHPETALVYGDVFVTGLPNQTFADHVRYGYHLRPDYAPEIMLSGCHMGPQPMWRRDIHETIGWFDDQLHSAGDYEFWCRIALRYPMLHIPEFLGLYFENPTGICNSAMDVSQRETEEVFRRYAGKLPPPPRSFTTNLQYRGKVTETGYVNIGMITFNRLDFTRQAIDALVCCTDFPYVFTVIDNASSDGTREYLREQKRKGIIKNLVLLDENVGVAKASNLAWSLEPNAEYYLKLDNDIVVKKTGWLGPMVNTLEGLPQLGAVAYSFEAVSYPPVEFNGTRIRYKKDTLGELHSLGGACFMIPARTKDKLGYWSEEYGLYAEEDCDYCIRMNVAGMPFAYMEDENIGIHLPSGKAAAIELDSLAASDGFEEQHQRAYRLWKDAQRRAAVILRESNAIAYRSATKSLFVKSGMVKKWVQNGRPGLFVLTSDTGRLKSNSGNSKKENDCTAIAVQKNQVLRLVVLSMDPTNHACAYYRIVSPMSALKEFVDIAWGIELRGHQYHLLPGAFQSADMFVVQRFFPQRETMALLDYICSLGKPVIYEIDDLLTQLPQTNTCYPMGVAGAKYIYTFLEKASALTVSTEELKRQFSAKHDSIYVLPNLLNSDLWSEVSPAGGERIVIGYAGTVTHGKDLEHIETALEQVSRNFGDRVAFLFMGCITERIKRLPNITYLQFEESYENYAIKLQQTQIDIMLVPLEDNPFNRCKSNIKWLEYSSCGITGIYSDLPPYNTCVVQGETGLLVENSREQWVAAIELLINNNVLRMSIAQKARAEVLAHYTLRPRVYEWLEVYRQIAAVGQKDPQTFKHMAPSRAECPPSPVLVSIIIPVFNKVELTEQCLKTLELSTVNSLAYELIVVDNGSTDRTSDLLKRQSPRVKVLSNSTNIGFAKACNQGAAAAKGDYLLFLNNDTELLPGWLEPLVAILESESSVGAVGSKLLFPDGTIQHAGVLVLEDQKLPDLLVARHIFYGQPSDLPDANRPMAYQVLTAACLLVRADAFRQVGGFDEGYWNGYEDVDLCFKLREQGWQLAYQPASVLIHHESKSGKERFAKVNHNIQRLHEKWLGKVRPDAVIDPQGGWHWIQDDLAWHGLTRTVKGDGVRQPPTEKTKGVGLVSIVILTFNQLWCTKECVESIQQYTPEPHEIVFVDNGSTDGTIAWLREQETQHDNYRLIENGKNLGFAKGCNQGIEAAAGEYILLLNNDVVVTTEWLAGLLDCYHRKPHVGIVGPMTNNISGIQRVVDVGYSDVAGMHAFAQSFRERNRYRMIENRRIVGFCMLFSKQVAEEVGLLDETFGSGNFEDDDYCLRAELAGYRNYIAGDVFIHHYGSQTFAGNKMDYGQAMQNNMALYRQKWNYKQLDEAVLRRLIPLDAVVESRRLAQQGDIDKAIDLLMQQGIRVAPDNPVSYQKLVELLIREGRFQDALEVLPEMPATVDPALKQELAAVCHCSLGDDHAAHQSAQQAAGRSRSLVVLGTLAARQGDLQQAELYFRQAIVADPACGSGWFSLGMLLWGQGKHDEAFVALKRAVTVDPLNREAVQILRDMAERLDAGLAPCTHQSDKTGSRNDATY